MSILSSHQNPPYVKPPKQAQASSNPPEFFRPSDKYQALPDRTQLELPPGGDYYTDGHTGVSYVRWPAPVPRPETVIDKHTGKPQTIAKPDPADQNPLLELQPESEPNENPSYVEADDGEAEERTSEENGSSQSWKKAQERDWAKTLKTTVLCGEELSEVELPPRQIIIPQWFNEGDCGFIFAPRGLGKTWMNLGLAIAIATKGEFGPYASEVEWPVLYVDGEMPFEVMRQRIVALHGSIPQKLYFLSHEILFEQEQATLNLSNFSSQQAITDFCLAKAIRVLILDNLSCLFSGLKENDADSWEPVKLWLLTLRRHRIAVIVVHHAGRNPNYMRGTTRREDDVFWVIRLEEPADVKVTLASGARFITRFTKNRGAPTEPLAYDWVIQPEGDHRVRVSFKESSSDDIIVAWVRDGLTSATDIAKEMDVSKGAISKRATRLIEQGRLEKHKRDYALGPVEQPNWHEGRDWAKT